MVRPTRGLYLFAAVVIAGACAAPTTSPTSTRPTSGASTTPRGSSPESSTTLGSPTAHRIGVRVVQGEGEFFNRQTGDKFVPRGFDWVRLSNGDHAAFDQGVYNAEQIDDGFERIAQLGYNTIRVFLSTYDGGVLGTATKLNGPYLDNVSDFIDRAAAHGLYVILTQDELAGSSHYQFSTDPNIGGINAVYLSNGGVANDATYFGDLVHELVARGTRLDGLLAYEVRNELYFSSTHPPFSMSSGTVTTANGQTYDLSSEDDHLRLLEDNLLNWIAVTRSAVLAVDPTALVTVGFFQPQGPVPSRVGDDRLIETKRAIEESAADFIDLHGYPGGELNLHDIVTNFKFEPKTAKPIVMGEFGAEHAVYPRMDDAVRSLLGWQTASCTYGFDGWLLWPWDSADQPEFWSGVDENGRLAQVLAPVTRPDPCTNGSVDVATNLAASATADASSAVRDYPPSNAIDGLAGTYWNSAAPAPQWIRLDLGAERTVDEISLSVAQSPAGASRHVVSVRADKGDWRVVHVFKGITEDSQLLVFQPDAPLTGVRFVQVETTDLAGGLWPAWREVNVLGR